MWSSSMIQPGIIRSAMNLEEHFAVKPVQPQTTARVRRMQERMKGRMFGRHAEPPTLAYSIVYFTTVALLCALCVEAAFR